VPQKEEAELWHFKRRRKNQVKVVLRRSRDRQEFQDQEFVVYGRDDLLQTQNRHPKGDAARTIAVLECKHYPLFIFCCEGMIPDFILNDERERRGMCQHICYGRVRRTNEAEMQVRC
jgi:hypothetical protein